MIIWPAKDPVEVFDYTWDVPVDSGDTVAAHTAAKTAGSVAKDSDAHTDAAVTVWISGGTDGEMATFNLTATTVGGRTFREAAILPVYDRATELLGLFRLRYPAFANVTDGVIGYWLADALRYVDDSWPEADQDPGRLALSAHLMSQAGVLPSAIPAGVTSFKSGTFSATVSDKFASQQGLMASIYGREFLDLRKRAFAGPRLAWDPPASVR